jgi:16S rRNA (guanine966-N2)-methyltransferase
VFDMVMHAAWGGRDLIEEARVLDAYAGTGAYGLEALSRGAGHAVFIERDRAALAALRANIATCRVETQTTVLAVDALRPSRGTPGGTPVALGFLDPPYAETAIERSVAALIAAGYFAAGTVIVAESAAAEAPPALAWPDRCPTASCRSSSAGRWPGSSPRRPRRWR